MDKKIAVVILNWNGCGMLRTYLPSVVSYSEADGAIVYVADNGSTDNSVETVRREFPPSASSRWTATTVLPTDTTWP